ncbi:hypothetical protein G7Z17_g12477 [Cylindrodendrum hubeiense]|uniref:Uncharacterized protein n=1 Tax=Cylindrodendrum hubeiense TaxID=595255 RepID=A0A9P5L980_9HYPO|nr:hypothetical protein G7Z17_g12477 [Cylindrodendrum hubeiense]
MNSSTPECAPSADNAFGPMIGVECRQGFDFTVTFEQSILVVLPASLLILAAPLRLFHLRNAPVKVAGHRLRHLKLAAIAVLAALHLALVVLWAVRPPGAHFSRVSVAAACVSFASSLMCCVLSYAEHAKSPRPSSLLNAFLFVSLLLDAALLRTLWLLPPAIMHASIPAVFAATFSLKAVLLVLEAWNKSSYLVAGAGPYAPEVTAGLYARAVFAWVTPLLQTGFRRLLEPADLFTLDEDMATSSKRKHHLIRCCIVTLRWPLVAVILPRLALLAFTVCQPLALNRFLIFLDDPTQPVTIGHSLIAAYAFIYFGIAVTQALYWHRNGRSITMLRGVLVSAIFSKATEISLTATDDSAAVTLMSSDVEVIVRAIKEIHEFWANVIQISIATWLLSIQIGYAASGPIIVSFVALLGTMGVAPLAKKYQIAWLEKTQKRVGITSAMIGHIKSIKMSGLTQRLSDTIANLRVEEIMASRPFRIVGSITSSIAQVPLLLSPAVAFAMFQGVAAESNRTLDATRMFSALSLIILLAQPLFWMFEVVLDMSAAFGAFERIEKFLAQDSRQEYRQVHSQVLSERPREHDSEEIELQVLRHNTAPSPISRISADFAIDVREANFAWSEERKVLQDITFTVRRISFLSSADLILCLEGDGKLSEQGTFDFLRNSGGYMQTLIKDSPGSGCSDHGDYIEPVEDINATAADSNAKPVENKALDKRRQLGDKTVYGYYFGSIGYFFVCILIMLEIVWAFLESFPSFFGVIAKAGLLAASSYYVAVAFPFLFALYFYLQRGYLRTSRQLRLLDLEEKAPVYTQFLETLGGLATLRAFGWAPAAIEANHLLVDRSQRPFYLLIMVQRWLVLVLDMTTAALALLVVGFAVMLRGNVDVGLTGVSLVQLIGLSETLNMLIQFWTSIETSIGAVARIKQFEENTGEENLPGETREPPMAWPDRGDIQIKGLSASYQGKEDVKVLDGISLDIEAGEKIGICGRTGSGKSSLILTILGLLDPSPGTITVDGLTLASLPRETIRTRFIAITQDQFVLPGTVRQNIDPFNNCSTSGIVDALRLVCLWDTIEHNGGLDAPFEEDILSHGQKQLFFLARAVLRKTVGRVVLLDEATSSVDQKTEEIVKRVVETQFRQHTVISIAHRLDTIVDFDRVIVMEKGCIVEVGKPTQLLASASKFKALWDASLGLGNQIKQI